MKLLEKEKILLNIEKLKDEKENLKWECENIFNCFLALLIGIATICITVLLSLKTITFNDLILVTSDFILLMLLLWTITNLLTNERENKIYSKKDKIIEEYKKLGIN